MNKPREFELTIFDNAEFGHVNYIGKDNPYRLCGDETIVVREVTPDTLSQDEVNEMARNGAMEYCLNDDYPTGNSGFITGFKAGFKAAIQNKN